MLFTQPIFLVFFAAVFVLHWANPFHVVRKAMLLVASYLFYGAWDWRFLLLIALSTSIDYSVGLILARPNPALGRKIWLVLSLAANLGILGVFKYFDFFVENARVALGAVGLDFPEPAFRLILPVGISFFTFQSMSYTIDVYRRHISPTKNALDFALFVAFFPQLVAGPIVRAATFLPQLTERVRIHNVDFKGACALFLAGFLKKACIADNIAPIVDEVFADPAAYDAVSIWIAVVFYAVQIYCDFSGYSDMAIAVARMLGYELTANFNFPYLASNIQEFWRRWHISLSTWLREYLYISLGGNRGSTLFSMRNLMLTMLLGGLWHGASWNFVVWGGLHGLALAAHRSYLRVPLAWPRARVLMKPIAMVLTFYWVCLAWIFFRAANFGDAFVALRAFTYGFSPGDGHISPRLLWWLVPMMAVHWFGSRSHIESRVQCVPGWLCAILFGAAAAVMLWFVPTGYRPFIYFQF